jgi:L-ribulose-5-phosphate 4-epimerase
MEVQQLREKVYAANMALRDSGLVLYTFGNVSGIDRGSATVVIKPSGITYDDLSPDSMVCVSLESGAVLEGDLKPSSDTDTHLELYRAFDSCGGVVHTHSRAATACAQARVPIRCMGTTHADYFHGDIPLTRELSRQECENDYETNTGRVIVEVFADRDPARIPAALVASHGPFVWGRDADEAVYHAVVVEHLAAMECDMRVLNPDAPAPPGYLIDKHYFRKHGANAYYGQRDR